MNGRWNAPPPVLVKSVLSARDPTYCRARQLAWSDHTPRNSFWKSECSPRDSPGFKMQRCVKTIRNKKWLIFKLFKSNETHFYFQEGLLETSTFCQIFPGYHRLTNVGSVEAIHAIGTKNSFLREQNWPSATLLTMKCKPSIKLSSLTKMAKF